MAENDLSQMSMFTLNNKRNFRYLDLKNTHMSSMLYYTTCEQLTDLESLEIFDVSTGNSCYKINEFDELMECLLLDTHLVPHVCRCVLHQINQYSSLNSIEIIDSPLTGCFSSFMPNHHPGLPELHQLYLKHMALNQEDL